MTPHNLSFALDLWNTYRGIVCVVDHPTSLDIELKATHWGGKELHYDGKLTQAAKDAILVWLEQERDRIHARLLELGVDMTGATNG